MIIQIPCPRRCQPERGMIDQARKLAARRITITVIAPGRSTELATLTPGQLLDMAADQDPAS